MFRRLLVVLLLAVPLHAQERTYRVPFHTVNGLILLDATVNAQPATLLLDTGANQSIVSLEVVGVRARLDALKSNAGEVGASGLSVNVKIDLRLEKRHWLDRPIVAMNLGDASKRLGTRIDGFVGQDILREFSAVRIDYKASVIEFEQNGGVR